MEKMRKYKLQLTSFSLAWFWSKPFWTASSAFLCSNRIASIAIHTDKLSEQSCLRFWKSCHDGKSHCYINICQKIALGLSRNSHLQIVNDYKCSKPFSTLSFEAFEGKRFQNLFNLAFKILNHPSIAFLSPNVSCSYFKPILFNAHLYHGALSILINGLFSQ